MNPPNRTNFFKNQLIDRNVEIIQAKGAFIHKITKFRIISITVPLSKPHIVWVGLYFSQIVNITCIMI